MRRTTLSRLSLPVATALGLTGLAASGTFGIATAGAATTQYVAMGDSFAAGEGGPTSLAGFDVASGSCHRTALAWPRVFAATRGLSLETTNGGHTSTIAGHIACGGANTTSITTTATNGEPAQLAQLRSMTPKPTLVTLTIGANDARLGSVMKACRTGQQCAETLSAARTLTRNVLPSRFARVFAQVKSATKARLIVVGYPQIYAAPSPAALAECSDLTSERLAELRAHLVDLDKALAAGAKAAQVEYVSMLTALSGHELCTSSEQVNPIAVTGSSLAAESGHPTAAGYTAMATRMSSYLTRYAIAPNIAPKAAFTFKRKAGTTNRVVLDASASADLDGSIATYTWTSGTTTLGTGKTLTITVRSGTTKRVTLTVKDNRGAKVSVTRIVSPSSTTAR